MTIQDTVILALYVLGAAGVLPAIRATFRDKAARVYYPTGLLFVAGAVVLLVWPLFTVTGIVRLVKNWNRQ